MYNHHLSCTKRQQATTTTALTTNIKCVFWLSCCGTQLLCYHHFDEWLCVCVYGLKFGTDLFLSHSMMIHEHLKLYSTHHVHSIKAYKINLHILAFFTAAFLEIIVVALAGDTTIPRVLNICACTRAYIRSLSVNKF